jgi:hypothetical protein
MLKIPGYEVQQLRCTHWLSAALLQRKYYDATAQ